MSDNNSHMLIPIALIPEGTDDIIGYIHLPAVPRVGEKLYVYLPELPNQREDQYQVRVTEVAYAAIESADAAQIPDDLDHINPVELTITALDQTTAVILANKLKHK